MSNLTPIINAAGKLTALGGSVQSQAAADAQAAAARQHVDLAELRRSAAARIANLAGAEAACITTGAAAGISISIAAILTGDNLDLIHQLPQAGTGNFVLLQAGHAINFGAPVAQMIRLGGGMPWILGSTNNVSEKILVDTLKREGFVAMIYVVSHHCVQTNQISLARCVDLCHRDEIPVVVDAAAEEDLQRYLETGADLVIYSGGKAFSGPTSGFIIGNADLIAACEMQSQGIARTMKVGKETIAGLMVAMDEFASGSPADRLEKYTQLNEYLLGQISGCKNLIGSLKRDEAGRVFERVAVSFEDNKRDIRDLVAELKDGNPSIRTRNHHLDEGYLLIDPRELTRDQAEIIATRLKQFDLKVSR